MSMKDKIKDLHDARRPITLKELDGAGETNVPIEIGTHLDLEKVRNFMDHGLMFDPNHPGRFPSSRDWNIPTIKCSVKTCVANYGKCTMPSLIEIGANGKCGGNKKRKSGKKK